MTCKSKSHSGLKKRVKITGKGKVFFKKQGNNHLLTNKGKTNKKSPYGKEVTGYFASNIKSLVNAA